MFSHKIAGALQARINVLVCLFLRVNTAKLPFGSCLYLKPPQALKEGVPAWRETTEDSGEK